MAASAMHYIALFALVLAVGATEVAASRPPGDAGGRRRRLSALETAAQAPAHNVSTRGITDCLFEDLENAFTGNACMHGRYCGGGCSGRLDGQSYRASPIDELDRACFFHDKCYDGSGSCKDCYCNNALRYISYQLWVTGEAAEDCGCALFQRACSNLVLEAASVYKWTKLFTKSNDCPDTCSNAAPGDQCSANVVYETDLYGGDFKDVRVADWAECCDLCASEPDCRAWTYTEGGCYMKDGSWTAEARKGLISGYL